MSLIFRYSSPVVEKKKKPQDPSAFGWEPFNDLDAVIAGLGYKTGETTPSQIDGVRLSETKEAHKS